MFIFGVAHEQPTQPDLLLPGLVACAEEEGEVRRHHPAAGLHVLERERVHHLGDHHLVVVDELVFESLSVDEGVVGGEVKELVRTLDRRSSST